MYEATQFAARAIPVVLFALALLVLVHAGSGLKKLNEVRRAESHLEMRQDLLNEEIGQLQQERVRILSDPEFFKQLAREEFGMVEPGGEVFIIPVHTSEMLVGTQESQDFR